MASQTGKQIITIHILFNITKSKCNQTMKFGQLIEYNMKKVLLEQSSQNVAGKDSPWHFYEKSKLSISLASRYILLTDQISLLFVTS